MRKLLYVVLGIILAGGAVSMFGARQGGWEAHGHTYRDGGSSRWALERSYGGGEPRSWFSGDRGHRHRGDGQRWFNVSNALDMLNALIGIAGIGLAVSAMRRKRGAGRE